jgi:hypothetical protein
MGFKLLGINGSLTPPPSRSRVILDAALIVPHTQVR